MRLLLVEFLCLFMQFSVAQYWAQPPVLQPADDPIILIPSSDENCRDMARVQYLYRYLLAARQLGKPIALSPYIGMIPGMRCVTAVSLRQLAGREVAGPKQTDKRYIVKVDPVSKASSHKISIEIGEYTIAGQLRVSPDGNITGIESGIFRQRKNSMVDIGMYTGIDNGSVYNGVELGYGKGDNRVSIEGERYDNGAFATELQYDTAKGLGTGIVNANGTLASYVSGATLDRVI